MRTPSFISLRKEKLLLETNEDLLTQKREVMAFFFYLKKRRQIFPLRGMDRSCSNSGITYLFPFLEEKNQFLIAQGRKSLFYPSQKEEQRSSHSEKRDDKKVSPFLLFIYTFIYLLFLLLLKIDLLHFAHIKCKISVG